jgi:hypothetical protein
MRWRPDHPWFGPLGRVWRPISREGWIVTIAYLLLFGAVSVLHSLHVLTDALMAGLLAFLAYTFLSACMMTSDTQDRTKQ